jgi:hypothetical protein
MRNSRIDSVGPMFSCGDCSGCAIAAGIENRLLTHENGKVASGGELLADHYTEPVGSPSRHDFPRLSLRSG